MKKSELRKLIREEIKETLNQNEYYSRGTARGGRRRSVDDEPTERRSSVNKEKRKEQIWDDSTRPERLSILKQTSVNAKDYDLYVNMDYDELPSGLLNSWEV